ncbi:MAG: M20/M25/M40 family metallo-hydrolase, partial [Vicinamibacteria bacterium]|nr:M20/M25/M40 family metallo-hydrolase [Vicinamibacteria bacterium]
MRLPRLGLAFLLSCSPFALGQDARGPVEAWVQAHQRQVVGELLDLLAIPNVAADRPNIERNAAFLKAALEKRGFRAEVLPTDGNPIVWGELRPTGASRTVLIYFQYDGQPVSAKGWAQPDPFEPVVRTGRIDAGATTPVESPRQLDHFERDWRVYGRSASDAKGPIVAFLAALDALAAGGQAPTVNVRVVMDGEEESGSPSLMAAIERYRDRLAADQMLVFDGPAHTSGRPTLVYGARGIHPFRLTVYGPKSGVHSGNYGNWVPNPALRLAHLLASMKDDAGNALVRGFYDEVPQPTAEELALIDAVPGDEAKLLKAFGVAQPEQPGLTLQRALLRPTLNVRGLQSAFVGAQARTIIPDRAVAEMDIRTLVETPGDRLIARVAEHVRAQGYHLVDAEPDDATRARYSRIARIEADRAPLQAFRTPLLGPESRRLAAALADAWGQPPVQLRSMGGSVPIAPFIQALKIPAVLVPIVNY